MHATASKSLRVGHVDVVLRSPFWPAEAQLASPETLLFQHGPVFMVAFPSTVVLLTKYPMSA